MHQKGEPLTDPAISVAPEGIIMFFFQFIQPLPLCEVNHRNREMGEGRHKVKPSVPLSDWLLIEQRGPAGSKCLLFPRDRIPRAGPSPGVGGQPCHLHRQKKTLVSLPTLNIPIMGTMRIYGTPPALRKIRHLAHAILSFDFQYHLQMYDFFSF